MFKPKSTTKKAKSLIRGEITHFYGNQMTGTKRRPISIMREDADNYNAGRLPREKLTDAQKGAGLVDAGCFRIYADDQKEFLGQFYGKSAVSRWSGTKCHQVYRHLIGREYAAILHKKKTKPPKYRRKRA